MFQHLVEALPAAVARYDLETGKILYASPLVGELTGISPDRWTRELNLTDYLAMVEPKDLREQYGPWRETHTREETYHGVYRLHGCDGITRWIATYDHALPNMGPIRQTLLFDITEQQETSARSRDALRMLVDASEYEQARVASELHDDAVQVMSALLLQLRMLGNRGVPVDAIEETLSGLLERTRRLMFELHPLALSQQGLARSVEELARNGPWQHAEVDISVGRLPQAIEALCYRTIREVILNARKHSHASTLQVRGARLAGSVRVTISDDGVGFDVANALTQNQELPHLGMTTMIERLRLAGGALHIDSRPGYGTRVTFSMPDDDPAFIGEGKAVGAG
jgi:signal transduction histidine kinase